MDKIHQLIERGALFVLNHSGGKDSQGMTDYVRALVPDQQLLVLHAHLPEVEWDGTQEHIRDTTLGLPLLIAQATKTFFEMVEHRGKFPSPKQRQCTSDLKRNPCEREIRRYLKSHPEFGGLVVNCMGMRAAESVGRAKLQPFKFNDRNSKAGREWYDWLPIHDWSTDQVFSRIREAGQSPFWTYEAGMSRKSCCFCIFANDADLACAGRLKPDLYRRYVETERQKGFTLSMSGRTLPEITGIQA